MTNGKWYTVEGVAKFGHGFNPSTPQLLNSYIQIVVVPLKENRCPYLPIYPQDLTFLLQFSLLTAVV